ARAICIRPRQDRLQPVMSPGVGELVAPQPDTGIVVRAVLVRLPEIDPGARYCTTPTRQDVSAQRDARALDSAHHDRVAHGRRFEVRPADLPRREAESVAGGDGCG